MRITWLRVVVGALITACVTVLLSAGSSWIATQRYMAGLDEWRKDVDTAVTVTVPEIIKSLNRNRRAEPPAQHHDHRACAGHHPPRIPRTRTVERKEAMKRWFQPATITAALQGSAATVADTNAPNISVNWAPSGSGWPGGTARINFLGRDREVINSTTYPANIVYAWKTNSGSYTAFSATNYIEVSLPSGDNTLWVKAADRAGNIAETSYRFGLAQGSATTTPGRNRGGAMLRGAGP